MTGERCEDCGVGKALWRTCSRRSCPNQAPRTASFEDAVQRVAALAGVRDLKDVPVRPVPCATCGDPIAVDTATGRITHVCRGTQVARRPVVIPPPRPLSDGLFDDSEDR